MTREEAIMANDSQKAKKIKTPFAKMIVEGNQEKPYFSILYFDPIDKDFYVGYSSYCLDYVSNWLNEEFEIVEDENFIIAALRPVSREQVKKVWFGCDICRGDKEVKSDNFCGAATMRIVGDSIDLLGDEKKIKFFGHIYAPSFSVRFCPFCGKPLTDEAVEMVMERLEALNDV